MLDRYRTTFSVYRTYWINDYDDVSTDFKKEILTEAINQDPDASAQYYHSYSIIMNMGTGFIIFLIVLLIIAIVATIIINKSPKLAGILLLIISIIGIVISLIAGILWIIAGIMLLARKPQNDNDDLVDVENWQ
ncbi:hypothetical protein DMB77_08170 [Staphylococcus saccharolyticus]|nr:hypothetical protein DMB74_07180 [Staphylococcus saccharolyticus]TAA92509.1 hypothetical protein DMB77_08170 [Staphylococcus saccharolyticus]